MIDGIFKIGDCARIVKGKISPSFPVIAGERWELVSVTERTRYFASDNGRCKSVSKHGVEKLIKPYWKTGGVDKSRRFRVHLGRGTSDVDLHSLVADKFVANPFKSKRIIFLDGNKENCSSTNLAYGDCVSREQQIQNFTNATDVKRTRPGIVDNVIQYVLTHDDKALNAAWTESLRVFRGTAYNGLFKRSGWKHIPCQELVSDIVQESLLKAQVAIRTGRLKNPRNIEGWLSRIVNNTAVTYGLKNHHISSAVENDDGEEFNMADISGYDASYAYTPAWGIM